MCAARPPDAWWCGVCTSRAPARASMCHSARLLAAGCAIIPSLVLSLSHTHTHVRLAVSVCAVRPLDSSPECPDVSTDDLTTNVYVYIHDHADGKGAVTTLPDADVSVRVRGGVTRTPDQPRARAPPASTTTVAARTPACCFRVCAGGGQAGGRTRG